MAQHRLRRGPLSAAHRSALGTSGIAEEGECKGTDQALLPTGILIDSSQGFSSTMQCYPVFLHYGYL